MAISRKDQEFLDDLDRLRHDVDIFFDQFTQRLLWVRDVYYSDDPRQSANIDALIAENIATWRRSTSGILAHLHDTVIPKLPPRYFD